MDDESFRQLYQSAHRSTSLVGSGGRGAKKRAVPARLSDAREVSHATSAQRIGLGGTHSGGRRSRKGGVRKAHNFVWTMYVNGPPAL